VGELLARATARTTLSHIRHVAAVPPRQAQGLVADVYRQVVSDFGMLAPPIALHAPAPRVLAASWLILRESLLTEGRVDRETKEAVAAAVSLSNRCPYCVEVHGATLVGLARDTDAFAVAADQIDTVVHPRRRAVAQWARTSATAGPTNGSPFPPEHAAELIGVAVTFHYLNRMVNVFLQPSPFPPGLPANARARVRRVAALLMRRLARVGREPGDSLDLLPAAPLPTDLFWAADNANLAGAFARAAAAIDAAAARSVPERVRALVLDRLAAWDGRPPGISSRAWLADATAALPEPERPAGGLALTTALAAYQATGTVIEDFRQQHPADDTLIELTAWSALAAARQIGHRLAAARRPASRLPAAAE